MAVTTQMSLSPAGVIPRYKRFTVVGIFRAGSGFGFDASLAFINFSDAQTLFQLGQSATGLHINIKQVYAAPYISRQLAKELGPNARMMDWTQQFGAFFSAVSLEKTMMFFYFIINYRCCCI